MADAGPVPAGLRPQRVVSVLGMHRSGTSCLAGSLEQQGLFLGEVNTEAPWNRRGNRESFELMDLQADVLEASGGSWDRPPEAVEWRPEHLERARQVLARYAGRPVWGFKDPRTLLTLEGWRALVPDLELVAIFRHPLSVARSLERRNNLDVESGLALWKAYNERLVRLHREGPFPIVSFDEDPDVLLEKLRKAGELIGLPVSPSGEPFFAQELRTARANGDALPPEVASLYAELRRLAL
jgi:hypothetical protein